MPPIPIDPLAGPRYVLEGRVVTMDDNSTVLSNGAVYVDAGVIRAVRPASAAAPAGFAGSPRVKTRGTIYPGLIELHNHLAYNVLPLWNVPQRFGNRAQWRGILDYRRLVTAPMRVLSGTAGCVEAIVRYVEGKCLLGGVTTSQGIKLVSSQGIQQYFRGIVRNVEQTVDAALPEALTRVDDVDAQDAAAFRQRLLANPGRCFLLHLSEGTDDAARQHFLALQLPTGEWAITRALAGIHAAGLRGADFEVLAENEGAMVWSPLSNLLLYGATADVRAANDAGVTIGLGSDWSPSGSKNLLGELKTARLVSDSLGGAFADEEIVAMATRNAAKILHWQGALGSLAAGKRADLVVFAGKADDPYAHLLESRETDISLVVINGIPRFGKVSLMSRFEGPKEEWRVGGQKRLLFLRQATSHPAVDALTLMAARDRLQSAMADLVQLALDIENAPPGALTLGAGPVKWFMVLDHDDLAGVTPRPLSPAPPEPLAPAPAPVPDSQLVGPMALDPLTVADDANFFANLAAENNLPQFVKDGLPGLY